MIIERIIYNLIAVFLGIYIMRSYINKRKEFYLVIAGGEVIAITFNILNLFNGVYYGNYLIEGIAAIFGIMVPGFVFLSDYFQNSRNKIIGLLGARISIFSGFSCLENA